MKLRLEREREKFRKEMEVLNVEYDHLKTDFLFRIEEEIARFNLEKKKFFQEKKAMSKDLDGEHIPKDSFEKRKFQIEFKSLSKRKEIQHDSFEKEGKFIDRAITKERESIHKEYQIIYQLLEKLKGKSIPSIETQSFFQNELITLISRERENEKNQILLVEHLLRKEKEFLLSAKTKENYMKITYKDFWDK